MDMARFVKATTLQQVHERRGTLVTIDGEDITIFKREGQLYAVNNICAHQHFSMLHQGEIQGYEVTCPMHGWTYDIRTGQSTTGQGRVASYNVKVVGEDVLVEVPDSL
jgi:nitrite reductase/ring-hydroxylating ferredoxin subunit